jgi:hypothetical protein
MKNYLKEYGEFVSESLTPNTEDIQSIKDALIPLRIGISDKTFETEIKDMKWFIILPVNGIDFKNIAVISQALERAGAKNARLKISPFKQFGYQPDVLCIETGIPVRYGK